MDYCNFLNSCSVCPSCGENLTLYLQIINGGLFKANRLDENTYRFIDAKASNDPDYYTDVIIGEGGSFKSEYKLSSLVNNFKNYEYFLFYLCNLNGIVLKGSGTDYEINLYKSCYYRSTPVLRHYNLDNDDWEFYKDSDGKVINKNESFRFSELKSGTEYIYMLSLDYEESKIKFWHYTVNEEQKASGSGVKLFEKELPLMNERPDFSIENRSVLLNKFYNWVLLS